MTVNETKSRLIALALMATGSTMISFGGLVIRNIEQADEWQLVFYRTLGMLFSVTDLLTLRYRRHTIFHLRDIGWPGIFGAMLVAVASVSFVQSVAHTTIANALFMLCVIPFISAGLARFFLKEALPWRTIFTMMIAAAGVAVSAMAPAAAVAIRPFAMVCIGSSSCSAAAGLPRLPIPFRRPALRRA